MILEFNVLNSNMDLRLQTTGFFLQRLINIYFDILIRGQHLIGTEVPLIFSYASLPKAFLPLIQRGLLWELYKLSIKNLLSDAMN